MATADLINRQGHEARVQGLLSNEDHNWGEGTPQITSIFGADEFRLHQLEDQALYDVRRALENGSEHAVSDDPEALGYVIATNLIAVRYPLNVR